MSSKIKEYPGIFYEITDSRGSKRGYLFGATHQNINHDPEFGINRRIIESVDEQEAALKAFHKEYGKNVTRRFLQLDVLNPTEEEKAWKKEFDEISKLKDIIWKTADETLVERVANYGLSEECLKYFYGQRNQNMTEKVNAILQDSGIHFIAVGSGHIVGQSGIVSLLQEKGWSLKKIESTSLD